ncbi:MAG TPA: ATP synthase F0 subunit B [Candidatus Binataceae bacterium]|nr:ATP synthase F0 subunit B [Candidatus Binataceae bacterium]
MLSLPPNWGTFAVLIVSFLVFWFIFKRLLFEPFLRLLSDRERTLKSLQERTELLLREGRTARQRREEELSGTRRQALLEREERRRQAEEQAGKVLEEARVAAKDSLERVRAQIERELRAAEEQLGTLSDNLAAELAEQVLGRPLRGRGPQVYSDN